MKKINKYIFWGAILVILFGLTWTGLKHTSKNVVKIAGQDIRVDLVGTPETRVKGLSGRIILNESRGMLFIFDTPGIYPFWMKDMKFAIDIIWLGEDKKVVYIKENATPDSYPESFTPDKNAKYVLEVVSGFSEKHNLKVGHPVEFDF